MLTAAVCVALTGAGLAVSFLHAYRRRFLKATRLAAWSLLPVGLYMTGLLPLGQDIGTAVADWVKDLVFDSSVWVGALVLALSAVLFVAVRVVERRGGRTAGRGAGRTSAEGGAAPAALGGGEAPKAARPGKGRPGRGGAAADDDLSDFREIEEILRRRGI